MDCTKTLKLRIKDKHAKVLRQMAREVNQVWNQTACGRPVIAFLVDGSPQEAGTAKINRKSCCNAIAAALTEHSKHDGTS